MKLNMGIIREEKYPSLEESRGLCCIHRAENSHIIHSNAMLAFNIYDALSCFILFAIQRKKKEV